MKSKVAVTLAHLLCFSLVAHALPQRGPLTKQEVIAMLNQTVPHKLSQAEIVAEVEQRGISFAVDEKVLGELDRAGARSFLLDAIKRAAKSVGRPEIAPGDFGDAKARQGAGEKPLAELPPLEQARYHAMEYAGELPNFIVTQMVSRYVRTADAKDWKLDDTLEIELTYREGEGEQHKLLRINGSPTREAYESVSGSTSTGEFGAMLAAIFSQGSKAEFKEVKKDVINGRASVVYDFTVKKANSRSVVSDRETGQKTIAGYSGSIWIDNETRMVLRIESANEGMPAGFPVTLSENAVEYDWVTIAGERYLLPVRAEVILGRDADRYYTRNVIEFKNYKKFEAKIKVPEN